MKPLQNPNLLFFGPLAVVWLYVAVFFARNWWRRRNHISLCLAFMPLGHLVAAARELHLLTRLSSSVVYSASLSVGLLTGFVIHRNQRAGKA